MDFAELAGVFVESNQHNHWHPPSDPLPDWKEEGSLLWAVRLVLQDDKADNMIGHFLEISQVSSSASLTFHCHAHRG